MDFTNTTTGSTEDVCLLTSPIDTILSVTFDHKIEEGQYFIKRNPFMVQTGEVYILNQDN